MDIYLFLVFCLETFCCYSKGLSFFLADLCYIITFHYPFLIAIFLRGVVSRGDRIYIYVIVRHGKIRSLRGQCVLTFFFFFFPGEKGSFMLFGLLGEGKGSKRLCLKIDLERKKSIMSMT